MANEGCVTDSMLLYVIYMGIYISPYIKMCNRYTPLSRHPSTCLLPPSEMRATRATNRLTRPPPRPTLCVMHCRTAKCGPERLADLWVAATQRKPKDDEHALARSHDNARSCKSLTRSSSTRTG